MLSKVITAAALVVAIAIPAAAAETGHQTITDYEFPFEGPFGTYDQTQLQRGLKVYSQVCAGCHGLKFVPIRTLSDDGGPGFSEEQAKAFASEMEVYRLNEDIGEYEYRTADVTDNFPEVTAAGAPDLSLMAKARAGFHGPLNLGINQLLRGTGGPEYIASLMTSYTGEEMEQAGTILYENTAFPGGWISMAPPLYGDDVEFDDGAPSDIESEAKDVAAFLMWTAEPKLAARKQMGFIAVIMLAVLSVLLYLTNKRIWAPVKGYKDEKLS
ncbi:cytochrome c1 [Jannaschia rubra]|uniref:Cytochrome c1 n=1 Tax=Jannaschia rubra TaxID=282197 RepID=A0A0M6XR13_9RHOB|nr:cytochrome c1 [Jannaschia rubra]CTQ32643.1 Cytochrome c1 precursor [Jannaschia rubra]SFF86604.1 ubiquinol-cytochrome c reductase cytochrome c1 subunit [Jannaschia rubra]